jgi:hypothetical protein
VARGKIAPNQLGERNESGSHLFSQEESMTTKVELPGPTSIGVRDVDVRITSAGVWTPERVSAAIVLCGLFPGLLLLYVSNLALEEFKFWIVYLVAALACLFGSWFLLAFFNHLRRGGNRTWSGRVLGIAILGLAGCYGAGLGIGSCYRVARSDREIIVDSWKVVYSCEVAEQEARQVGKALDRPGVLPTWFNLFSKGGIWLDRDGQTYVVTLCLSTEHLPELWLQSRMALVGCAGQLSTSTFAGQPVRLCLRIGPEPPFLVVDSTDL